MTNAAALAISSTASDEQVVLASDAGSLGWELLEKVDARLREAVDEHDFLDRRDA